MRAPRTSPRFRPTMTQPARLLSIRSPSGKADARALAERGRPLRLSDNTYTYIPDVGGSPDSRTFPVRRAPGDQITDDLPCHRRAAMPDSIDAVSREWVWLPSGDWLAVSPITLPSACLPGVGGHRPRVRHISVREPQSHFRSLFLSRSRNGWRGSGTPDRLDRNQRWGSSRVKEGTIVLLLNPCPNPRVKVPLCQTSKSQG